MSPKYANSGKSNEVASGKSQDARPPNNNEEWCRVEPLGRGVSEVTAAARGHRHNYGRGTVRSLVGKLLCDIYGTSEANKQGSASDHNEEVHAIMQLMSKDILSLKLEKEKLKTRINDEGNELIQQLQMKNFLYMKREAHCDLITAYIQAVSSKTREDTKIRFSLSPSTETGFSQWLDAMKMVAQLPEGMPSEFRTRLWLQLSEKHLSDQKIDWDKAEATIFNEWTNPDDEELGVQIVKDLHRTGCSLFCGEQERNQALLKRVLLAYARWNKNVGYCQGFNMLAALILQVMEKNEKNAVKVMIYLIEGVLPESYFANNLRGLSVDMTVFRDLLRLRLPKLSKHLEALQNDPISGTNYEPPLTNVFTMQWFLTLFSNCLPHQTVLRVWDLVFLYGNEVLLRTALAIWAILQDRVISAETADEFYSIMGVVTREMLEFGLMDANTLVKKIAMVDPFPNELQELREKYLYNISPWNQSVQCAARKGIKLFYNYADDQDDTEDEDKVALTAAYGVFRRKGLSNRELQISFPTLDIGILKQQYAKLRQRQRQAHVIITAAYSSNLPNNIASGPGVSVNHLLMGKSALVNKERRIGPPEGSIPLNIDKKVSAEDVRNKVRGKVLQCRIVNAPLKDKKMKFTECKENEAEKVDKIKQINSTQNKTEETWEVSEEENSESSTSTELCDSVSDEEDSLNLDIAFQDCKDLNAVLNEKGFEELLKGNQCFKNRIEYIKSDKLNGGSSNTFESKIKLDGLETKIKNFGERLQDEGYKKNENEIKKNETHLKIDQITDGQTVKFQSVINKDFSLESGNFIPLDNTHFIDYKPEVPTNAMNIKENKNENPLKESLASESEPKNVKELIKDNVVTKKSEIGINVIRENLQMLHKFYALRTPKKSSYLLDADQEFKSKKKEEKETQSDMKSKHKCLTLEENETEKPKTEIVSRDYEVTEIQKVFPLLSLKSTADVSELSAVNGSNWKVQKLNKEVNTEITFGVEEFPTPNDNCTENAFLREAEFSASVKHHNHKDFFNDEDADEVQAKIELSKNDWELKMKKIAELETTTRKTLQEMHDQSVNRNLFRKPTTAAESRRLNENSKESYLKKKTSGSSIMNFNKSLELLKETDDITLPENINVSFDATTSRTEELLKKVKSNPPADDFPCHQVSMEPPQRSSSNATKMEDDFREDSNVQPPSFLQHQSKSKLIFY